MSKIEVATSIQTEITPPKNDEDLRWIMGDLAKKMHNAYQEAKNNDCSAEFLNEVIERYSRRLDLPEILTIAPKQRAGKRQPDSAEAFVETAKRLLFLEALVKDAPMSVMGIIAGGSLAYGKFFNVRGNNDPSDIDPLYIVDYSFFSAQNTETMFRSSLEHFSTKDLIVFRKQLSTFPDLKEKGEAETLNQKFNVGGKFLIDVKILPFAIFQSEFDKDLESAFSLNDQIVCCHMDYRYGYAPFPNKTQLNFRGKPFIVPTKQTLFPDGSVCTPIPGFVVSDDEFYTGINHNLILPTLDLQLDREGKIIFVLERFKNHLRERLFWEREKFGDNTREVVNALPRKSALSPQVLAGSRRIFG